MLYINFGMNLQVFLYNGSLQIVPLPNSPAELAYVPVGQLSITKALTIIRDQVINTTASTGIQQAISNRIKE